MSTVVLVHWSTQYPWDTWAQSQNHRANTQQRLWRGVEVKTWLRRAQKRPCAFVRHFTDNSWRTPNTSLGSVALMNCAWGVTKCFEQWSCRYVSLVPSCSCRTQPIGLLPISLIRRLSVFQSSQPLIYVSARRLVLKLRLTRVRRRSLAIEVACFPEILGNL